MARWSLLLEMRIAWKPANEILLTFIAEPARNFSMKRLNRGRALSNAALLNKIIAMDTSIVFK